MILPLNAAPGVLHLPAEEAADDGIGSSSGDDRGDRGVQDD